MPVIKIWENEDTSFASFDATENTVLIPMLYARDYIVDSDGNITYETTEVKSMLYKDSQQFRNDMVSHRIFVDAQGSPDKSYVMAYELLLQGLSVIIKPILFDNANYEEGKSGSGTERITVVPLDDVYDILDTAIGTGTEEEPKPSVLEEFRNRNLYNIKFITSGAYTNCGTPSGLRRSTVMYTVLKELASDRGDAIALVEFAEVIKDAAELVEIINGADESNNLYAAAFFPWYTSSTTVTGSKVDMQMPACFGYLMAYAKSVRSNSNWFAASGVIRGDIPNFVDTSFEVGDALMHLLQCDEDAEGSKPGQVVNPIYNAGGYGHRIWGNRVMGGNTEIINDRFMNFLNVRILLCDIKKQIYHAAMRVTFEPNDDIVWINFKTLVNPNLEKMKSGRGISWYKWVKEYTKEKATINAVLTIRPIEALENIKVNVILTDEDASISELV